MWLRRLEKVACTTAARWPLRAPVRCFTSSNSCKDSWDPKQYLAHKETFQGQFAADYLTLPSESGATLAARLGRASRLLDLGSGDGSHTRRMAEFLPTGASATGLDLSPSMVAAAQASQISNVASKKVPVDFVAGNIATWGKEAANCGQFDLATSFMALHWVSEADLPATLSGLRAALAHARAGTSGSTSDNRSWFVASFHGDNSMQSLVDAVNTTVDATQLSTGGGGSKNTSAEASVDASSPALSSWGQAGAAVAAARWREHFRHGRASWRPITMLPAAQWRQLLHDAGFNVDDGVVKIRLVDTVYPDAEALVARLAAAWGPMFPTLPHTQDRNAFFQCVAETAVAQASVSACDPRPVVVTSRVLDIAVPTAPC